MGGILVGVTIIAFGSINTYLRQQEMDRTAASEQAAKEERQYWDTIYEGIKIKAEWAAINAEKARREKAARAVTSSRTGQSQTVVRRGEPVHEYPYVQPWFMGQRSSDKFLGDLHDRVIAQPSASDTKSQSAAPNTSHSAVIYYQDVSPTSDPGPPRLKRQTQPDSGSALPK
jgi:hypothetical protein